MNSKLTKFISILSVFLMMVSVVGCANKCNKTKTDDKQSQAVDNSANHYQSITETNNYLVRNGMTEYYIVYPEDPDKAMSDAVSELKYFFKEATKIDLRSVTDVGMTHDDSNKVLSIGRTNLFKTSGLTIDENRLGNDGHIVKTVGNTIYMVGGGYSGNLYAVYTFLEKAFNYDTFVRDSFTIDKVSTFKLYNYDVVEIPDIMNRRPGTDYDVNKMTDYDEVMNYNRLRVYNAKYGTLPIHYEYTPLSNKGVTHNAPCYLPDYIYKEKHPYWYSTAVPQDLCYTAHGDETELSLMIEEVAKKIEYSLTLYTPKEYPHMNLAVIQKLDAPGECACDGCMEQKTKYGTQSAAVIKFVNRVSQKVVEWMEKPENADYKRINFKFGFLAYHQFTQAPAIYNESTKKYEPIDESVVLSKNSFVQHAPIYNFDTQSSLYHEVNEGGLESMERWQAVCSESSYSLWSYGNRPSRPMYYYDSLNHFNNDYFRFLYKNGKVGLYFCERNYSDGTTTGFEHLKDYVQSKLTWNCNLDMNALIEKWFNGVFGDAAPYIRQYFDELRFHTLKTAEENGMVVINSMYYGIDNKKYWPYYLQNRWLKLFDQAVEVIAPLESKNCELYDKIMKNIMTEYIAPTYIMLNFYKSDMPVQERNTVVQNITNAARMTKIGTISGMDTNEYLRKLYDD